MLHSYSPSHIYQTIIQINKPRKSKFEYYKHIKPSIRILYSHEYDRTSHQQFPYLRKL